MTPRHLPFLIAVLTATAGLVLSSTPGHSAILQQVMVSGKVTDFSEKWVRLETRAGMVRVPRDIVNERELRPGNFVRVRVDLEDVVRWNASDRIPANK